MPPDRFVSDRGQKIRDSCNSCSSQKTRCSKERPTCARCQAKGLECNYSFSQRTGRRGPSIYGPLATFSVPAPPANDQQRSAPFNRSTTTFRHEQPTLTTAFDQMFDPNDAFMFDSMDSFQTSDGLGSAVDSVMEGFPDISWSPTEEDPGRNLFDTEASSTTQRPQPNRTESGPSTESQSGAPSRRLEQPPEAQQPQQPLPSPALSKSTTHKPSVQPQMPSQHLAGDDCLMSAMKVVADLHITSSPCITSDSDMVGMRPPKAAARDIDNVLFQNRDAIGTLKHVLECPCAKSNTVLLACYMAASSVVTWYGAAIGLPSDTGDGSEQASGPQIVSRPIFMGRYCLDSNAEQTVRARIVLDEIREHVQPLLAKMPLHYVSGHDRSGSLSSSSSMSSMMTSPNDAAGKSCALRDSLRRVIAEAERKIQDN